MHPNISQSVYKRKHCSNTYTLSTRYDTHLLRHSKNMELFLCNICGQTFHTKRLYKVHTYKHEDTNATRKSTRNVTPMKQNTVSSLHNSPITSTPFSIKLNKLKSKAKQRSEKNSNSPSSPHLPEIRFIDEQTISLQNKTNSAEPTYPCDFDCSLQVNC